MEIPHSEYYNDIEYILEKLRNLTYIRNTLKNHKAKF